MTTVFEELARRLRRTELLLLRAIRRQRARPAMRAKGQFWGSVITDDEVCPGASASSTFTGAFPSSPDASRSAVCRARTSGLLKISSTVTSRRRRPLTSSLKRLIPRSVRGRLVSSGHSLPRSAAIAWRTR